MYAAGAWKNAIIVAASIFISQGVWAEEQGLPLHGFADVGAGSNSSDTPVNQQAQNFLTGTVDLYLTPDFGNRITSLLEIAFEPDLNVGTVGVDVERIQMGYSFNDYFNVTLGRMHTPYGYWNTAYHHGAQLQTSIYRPRFLDFEDKGGILPAHTVGFMAYGSTKLGDALRLNYDLYTGNGSHFADQNGPDRLDPGLTHDDDKALMVGGRLALRVTEGALEGLTIGGHALKMRSSYGGGVTTFDPTAGTYTPSTAIPGFSVDVMMSGGYLVYEGDRLEFFSEFYQFSDKDPNVANAPTKNSNATYAQIGYAVTSTLKPYYRWEEVNLDLTDKYFSTPEPISYHRNVVGIRYDVDPKAALKLEYLATKNSDKTNPVGGSYRKAASYEIYQLQYAIRF
ncbi:MAG: hypothetical protein ACXVCY_12420 [Pseudobdellovibrionaceae bacterium]